jgi:hypothetical protein
MNWKLKPWTIALMVLIVADSVFTAFLVNNNLAVESNPLINWFMDTFSCSIDIAMILRAVFLLPLLVIINNLTNYSKHITIAYLGIYFVLVGIQVV